MTAAFLIRPARPDDRAALIEQFLGLNLHEDAITGNRRRDRPGAVASLAQAEKRVAEKNGVRLVAERDGKVVGHLFLIFDRHEVFVREEMRDHAHVTELFVREEVRGLGAGYALLREAERIASARGLGHMTIGVLAGNESAERAYERFGFRPHAAELFKPLRSPGA
jgi:GNAT superfamily N-acetyltransferase